MKNVRLFGALLGVLSITVASLGLATPAQAVEVSMPDSALKACVNARLGQPATAPISDTQAASITSLSCFQMGITNLQGISALSNLDWLNVGANNISDLSPLSGLSKLTNLTAANNKLITDLTPLSSLGDLSFLVLSGNQISNLAPLSGLTNLTLLDLAGNKIKDVSALSSLKNLKTLWLHVNQISDVTPLSGLISIRNLAVGSNEIRDISPLGVIANLIANSPAEAIDATNQRIVLPAIAVGATQQNPLVGYNGDRVSPAAGTAPIVFAADGSSWKYTQPGSNTMSFTRAKTHNASVNFSGTIRQEAILTPSTLKDDTVATAHDTPVTIDVLANDGGAGESPLVPSTLTLLDTSAQPVPELSVAEGKFTIVNSKVFFTPVSGFSGLVPEVRYQVTNMTGWSGSAALVVTVKPATIIPVSSKLIDDTATTDFQTPLIVDVLSNDGTIPALDPASLKLEGANKTPVDNLANTAGTFIVSAGKILFTPAPGFSGAAPEVRYQVTNMTGWSGSAALVVTVKPATVAPVVPVIPENPTANEHLPVTGIDASTVTGFAGLVILSGFALVVAAFRRKRTITK